MSRWQQTFLLLTALLLSSATVCFLADATATSPDVHHCGFDDVMYKKGVQNIIKIVPKQGEESIQPYLVSTDDDWDTIRINVSMKDLQSESKYCKKGDAEKRETRPDFLGENVPCTKEAEITPEKMKNLTDVIIPEAV
ncbi:surface protease GP63, partial [Trypanosoma theileri]